MSASWLKSALLSLFFLVVLVGAWHLATLPKGERQAAGDEYAKLLGKGAKKSEGFPTPAQIGETIVKNLSEPFYDRGPNDKGIGIQLAHSLARVGLGYLLAILLAVPLGFVIGMSPLIYRALDPFIQVLKPISPLAWMPIALYTIKDSSISGVFVIFICSVWPTLINTAYGVAAVRSDWLNVAKTLEVKPLRRAFGVILPAEMLVGGTGIGYFVWNEWNNLNLANVIFAILTIGVVGMALDLAIGRLQKLVTYVE